MTRLHTSWMLLLLALLPWHALLSWPPPYEHSLKRESLVILLSISKARRSLPLYALPMDQPIRNPQSPDRPSRFVWCKLSLELTLLILKASNRHNPYLCYCLTQPSLQSETKKNHPSNDVIYTPLHFSDV